jgi:hypothetical protein
MMKMRSSVTQAKRAMKGRSFFSAYLNEKADSDADCEPTPFTSPTRLTTEHLDCICSGTTAIQTSHWLLWI